MTIATESRNYSNNLRKLRRHLGGRGVNLRMTVVTGSVYADTRITIPGLHSDDAIAGIINLTNDVDVAGYLNDQGAFATVTAFSVNKQLVFTALRGGTEGNKIYVTARATEPDASTRISAALEVRIGGYDAVMGTTGNSGKTIILVLLATDSSGVALSSAANSAANVRAAILDAQEAMIGDAIVSVTLGSGSGVTAWTALSPTALAGGTDFDQGPHVAELLDNISVAAYPDILLRAKSKGAGGNSITLTIAAGAPADPANPTVAVVTKAITVTVNVASTTVQNVVDAINNDADASALVLAQAMSGGIDTSTGDPLLAAAYGPTALTGGLDPGIELTVASAVKLLVVWFTRDERDEN